MYQKATVCYVYLELKLSKLVDIVRTVCQRLSIKCNPIFDARGGPFLVCVKLQNISLNSSFCNKS